MSTQAKPRFLPATYDLDQLRELLSGLYRELDQAIAGHGPVCELSGRCCRFKEHGHTLFLSAPEAALLLADAPDPVRELDDGETCPWQDHQGRCTAREARPMGCRVYYCDPRYQEVAPRLSEEFLRRLNEMVTQQNWPWNYAPLHHHLAAVEAQPLGKAVVGPANDSSSRTQTS
jgi:hypothetical protein